jgi:glucokinase
MILAGDIGGTSTRLAIFDTEGVCRPFHGLRVAPSDVEGRSGESRDHCPVPIVESRLSSRDYPTLGAAIRQFMSSHDLWASAACFGIAGPLVRGRVQTPNLPWVVDAGELARQLRVETVWLINDLEANAYGLEALDDEDFAVLNAGARDASGGNAAIIAAGTGLGEAGLYWDGRRHRPFACEGGHADFAPRNDREADLLRYLLTRFERVSYERVLSGPGLHNIYQFLRDTGRHAEPPWLTDQMREQSAAAAISRAGLAGTCELCVEALDLFTSFYGAEAGNLALKLMATSGTYVGGGIAPRIVEKLKDGTFMNAFVGKGRMTPLMHSIPVRVVLNDRTALIGAARYAALRLTSTERIALGGSN